ncbi:MAG TPA: HlyD family secretion protein [Stellaceae bacterium]|nr:HlyD family secretion protein [Stellaceae bacterium]
MHDSHPTEAAASQDGNGDRGPQRAPERETRRSPGKWPLVVLAVVVIAAAAGGAWYYLSTRGTVSTDDAYTDGVPITMASKVAGYVTELNVTDNQLVHAGDLLLRIDPRDFQAARDQAAAAVKLADAQLENARINLEIAKVTFPARLSQADAQRDQAQANLTLAEREYRRQRSVDPRATTQDAIDTAAAQQRADAATLQNNQAAVSIARLVPENIGQAEAQVRQLEAQLAQAQAQLAAAELNLSYTELRAPQDGWITKRNVARGTYVQVGQAAFSIVTRDIWVTANFKETELDGMQPGQQVRIRVDAYPQLRLTGHVDSIQMGSGSRFTAFPPENATGNWVKIVQRVPVKIVIDQGIDPQKGLPLGLSVEPTVTLK